MPASFVVVDLKELEWVLAMIDGHKHRGATDVAGRF